MVLWRSKRRSFFNPSYNELSLSMISLSCLMLFFSTEKLRRFLLMVADGLRTGDALVLFIPFVFVAICLLLPFYHLLTSRKKTRLEKKIMLIFAIMTNAGSGILASMYVLSQSLGAPSLLLILPVWNICNCLMLVGFWEHGIINESSITDENAQAGEVLGGLLSICGVFVLCRFVVGLYWALTLSACVIYATGYSDIINAVFHPGREVPSGDGGLEARWERDEKDVMAGKEEGEKCGFCGRRLLKGEKPWVINRKLVVCKECYDKIQAARR